MKNKALVIKKTKKILNYMYATPKKREKNYLIFTTTSYSYCKPELLIQEKLVWYQVVCKNIFFFSVIPQEKSEKKMAALVDKISKPSRKASHVEFVGLLLTSLHPKYTHSHKKPVMAWYTTNYWCPEFSFLTNLSANR